MLGRLSLIWKEVSSTPSPDSMGNQGDGLGGVLDSARRGFEDEGGEGRLGGEKRKENNPWGVQVFNLFTPPFVNDNNELCERKRKLSSLLLLMWYVFHSVVSRIPCDQGASRNMLWKIHWGIKIVKGLSFVKAWGNRRKRLWRITLFRDRHTHEWWNHDLSL